MIETEATDEVCWTAFKGLTRAAQQAVLRRILRDQNLRHDLMDLALIEERRDEPTRPLRDTLKEKQN